MQKSRWTAIALALWLLIPLPCAIAQSTLPGTKPLTVEGDLATKMVDCIHVFLDRKTQELHYWYGRSLEANKQLKEACDVYSKLIRWNVSFMDARKRLSDLRGKLEASTAQ